VVALIPINGHNLVANCLGAVKELSANPALVSFYFHLSVKGYQHCYRSGEDQGGGQETLYLFGHFYLLLFSATFAFSIIFLALASADFLPSFL
jgi:hypothetical protein